jgi:hypothetical protein
MVRAPTVIKRLFNLRNLNVIPAKDSQVNQIKELQPIHRSCLSWVISLTLPFARGNSLKTQAATKATLTSSSPS